MTVAYIVFTSMRSINESRNLQICEDLWHDGSIHYTVAYTTPQHIPHPPIVSLHSSSCTIPEPAQYRTRHKLSGTVLAIDVTIAAIQQSNSPSWTNLTCLASGRFSTIPGRRLRIQVYR